MRRTQCSACGGDLDQFLDLGNSPIADAYTATPDEVSPTYPLQVAVCAKCRLVQLLEVIPAGVLFGSGYSFYSSSSPPLSAYHEAYVADVLRRYRPQVERGVVEVGCNDGDLLRHLTDFPALGVDPAAGPAGAARERGLEVLVAPFGLAVAHEIRDRRGRQGLVIANHVLAHAEDVADVLAGISALLADDGLAMVEVQYLPDLLVNNAFDLVYHEHRNFFSLSSLEQAAHRHGLFVIDAQLTDRQGGSLRVTLAKPHPLPQEPARVVRLRHSEMWLDSFGAYEGMQGRAERIRARLLDLIDVQPPGVAAYGAPAKATTLLNYCHINADTIAFVMDPAREKLGRYIPGTGIQIVAPGETMDRGDATVVLLAWNYAAQIMRQYETFTRRGGQWIVPFPAPVLL